MAAGAAEWISLSLISHGWESNRLLSIGIGGGIGWVMLLNVWGLIWRIQKRLIPWTRDNATNGTLIPDKAKATARQAFLASRANAFVSVVMLFFMGAASLHPMFGNSVENIPGQKIREARTWPPEGILYRYPY